MPRGMGTGTRQALQQGSAARAALPLGQPTSHHHLQVRMAPTSAASLNAAANEVNALSSCSGRYDVGARAKGNLISHAAGGESSNHPHLG